jgi:hypothetical protein
MRRFHCCLWRFKNEPDLPRREAPYEVSQHQVGACCATHSAAVAVGWNSERFDGRNLALRLVALGYKHVDWYRGGREAGR